jgi:hypothetical protein
MVDLRLLAIAGAGLDAIGGLDAEQSLDAADDAADRSADDGADWTGDPPPFTRTVRDAARNALSLRRERRCDGCCDYACK